MFVSLWMCVCLYTYMFMHMYWYICVWVIHTYLYVRVWVWVRVNISECIWQYLTLYACVYAHAHGIYVFMGVYVCLYVYTWGTECGSSAEQQAQLRAALGARNMIILMFWRQEFFCFLFFYLSFFFEVSHDQLHLDESALAEATSCYLLLGRKEEVRDVH